MDARPSPISTAGPTVHQVNRSERSLVHSESVLVMARTSDNAVSSTIQTNVRLRNDHTVLSADSKDR
jgi:hypothetical protein